MNQIQAFWNRLKSSSPVRLIVLSFLFLIAIGTALLMLPICARDGNSTDFWSAAFTSVSATSVSGLVLFDTWTHWSGFGQAIILIFIQIGALGLVTFMTGFTLFMRHKLGLRDRTLAMVYTSGNLMDIPRLIKTILYLTFMCETIGALILMIRFIPQLGPYGIWVSVFLSVSSYCNAGFDIMGFESPDISMQNYVCDPLVSVTISVLIFLGGIGFIVINDILSCCWARAYKKEKKARLNFHSKVVLTVTVALSAFGTVVLLLLEYHNSFSSMSFGDKLSAAFFESTTARSAGFINIDPSLQHDLTKEFMMFLMFIGASPCSTGGGIKTTTFAVLISCIVSLLMGKNNTVLFKHFINKTTVYRSLTITILAMGVISIAAVLIFIIELNKGFAGIDVLFETVSAFSTGISIGVTAKLSSLSKIVLCVTMFIGRVGPFSLVLALYMQHKEASSILPAGKIIIG